MSELIKFNQNCTHNIVINTFGKQFDYNSFKVTFNDNGWLCFISNLSNGLKVSFQTEFKNFLSKYLESFKESVNVFDEFQIGIDDKWIEANARSKLYFNCGALNFYYNGSCIDLNLTELIISNSIFISMVQSQLNSFIPMFDCDLPF